MGKVAIVTDSTATVPEDLVDELGIQVIPVMLVYGRQAFRDGIDIVPGDVYRQLRAGADIPTSAPPSVGDLLRVYTAVGHKASGIVSIHMSPGLSSTYNVALTASQLLDGVPIRVVNCNTAAMGQGFVVLEAARAAAAGAKLDEVVSRAEEVAARMHLLFTLETFEYLRRGGRIGGAAALAGAVLKIRPVLYLAGDHVDVFAKPRTKRKALRLILGQMAREVGDRPLHAAVFHADVPEEAEELRRTVAEQFNCAELYITEFTPVMGAHTGPGLLGVAFYAE